MEQPLPKIGHVNQRFFLIKNRLQLLFREWIATAFSHWPSIRRRWTWLFVASVFTTQVAFSQEVPVESSLPASQPVIHSPLSVHLVVTEGFLNRIVSHCDVRPGKVEEFVFGTPVEGDQVTNSCVSIDVIPSSETGHVVMILNGETFTNTLGFSPEAVVNSLGRQQFRATKEILFNGYEFATRHARVSARAENQNVGAVTKFTGRPLGPLVEHVVLSMAEQRQPAAEEYARQRVVERVYPEFDNAIDTQLANGNQFLKEQIQARLQTAQLMPDLVRVRSTDSHLHFAASMTVPRNVSEIAPAPDRLVEPHEVSVYLHETMFQGLIARANLAGQKTTVKQLLRMTKFLGVDNEISIAGLPDLDVEIEFAEVDPLQIQIVEDETRVTLRAAFKPAGQSLLPPLEITIPIRLISVEDDWQLKAGPVTVRSTEPGSDGTSIAEISVKKILEGALPSPRFPKQLPATYWPEGKTPPSVTSIRSAAGWLVFGMD